MADTLRERLIAANLASETFTAEDGYLSTGINSNTEAADRALAAVAEWIHEEADQRRSFAYNNAGNDYLLDQAATIDSLADTIGAEAADHV